MTEFNQGQIFTDNSKTGKDRKWKERKLQNINLAKAFKELEYKINENVFSCAEVLKYKEQADGSLKLYQTWFCKNKLCPICNWRRAMKYSYQTSLIVDEAIKRHPKGRFLFLTLTVKNVLGDELNQAISELAKSFDRLFRRAKVKKNMLGYLRATEITRNEERNDFHPHIHILMFVKSSYFSGSGDNYISQEEWTEMWEKSAKLDYIPVVNVKAVRPQSKNEHDPNGMKKAILETAKYPTKPIDYNSEDIGVVRDLHEGMYRKRLISFGGLFKEIRKELNLDNVEEGDLINTSDEDTASNTAKEIVAIWNWDRQNYFVK